MGDLYVITQKAEDAMECFGLNGVRHVAELDSGEGFVACDTRVTSPVAGVVFEDIGDDGTFAMRPKIRRTTPPFGGGAIETFGLYTKETFVMMPPMVVEAVSFVGMGLVLAMTTGKQPGAIWQATALSYRDVRVPESALV
jgi:hypothetical protein